VAVLPSYVEASEGGLRRRVTATKRALLKRAGLRMSELSWQGREVLGLYAATLSKLQLIDAWLESHEPIDGEGRPVQVLALYATYANTASRQLAELRAVVEQMAREDDRYDRAVQKLIDAGRQTKAGRADTGAAREIEPPVELRAGFEASFEAKEES
jgi:hypothetical protein